MADSYLQRTPSGAGNRKTFTISAWVKRSKLDDTTSIFSAHSADTTSGHFVFRVTNHNRVGWSQWSIDSYSTRLIRDTNAWYHFVLAVDTTQNTASDRVKLYVNGVQETNFSSVTYPGLNEDLPVNNTDKQVVGANGYSSTSNHWDGCLSHVAVVDGQQLTPTSFGETDSTSGIWKFKSPSGLSWGTNGFHLKFENSGNLGLDSSGQTNNYTVNGTLKQSIDTPSNVYATMNAAFNLSDIQLTEAAMRVKNTNSNWKYVNSTLAANKGKWYCEQKINLNGGNVMLGVTDMAHAIAQDVNNYTHSGAGTGSVSIYDNNGYKYIQGSDSTYAASYTTGDIIGCALDMDNNKVYFSKNGAWATGSGAWGSTTFDAAVGAITLPTTDATYSFATSVKSSAVVQLNFGTGQFGATTITSAGSNGNGSLFEYDVPSGFYALNTKNINTYG